MRSWSWRYSSAALAREASASAKPALGEEGARHRAVHPGDERGVTGLGCEGEGELGGLGGAGLGAHVHVRAYDGGVEQQQRVGVVQAAPVQLVEGGLQQVDRVPQLPGEVVGDGPAAQGGDAGRERRVREAFLRPLEVEPGRLQLTGLDPALPESEQGGGPLRHEAVLLGLREQFRVLPCRLLRLPGGQGPLGLGEAQPQIGDEPGGAAGGQLLEVHAESLGDVSERLVGGPHPACLQGRDIGGGVRRLGQLPLRQPLSDPQPLHPTSDDLRLVPLTHGPNHPNSP